MFHKIYIFRSSIYNRTYVDSVKSSLSPFYRHTWMFQQSERNSSDAKYATSSHRVRRLSPRPPEKAAKENGTERSSELALAPKAPEDLPSLRLPCLKAPQTVEARHHCS